MHTHIHTHIHTHTHAHTYTHMYTHEHTHAHTCTHMHTHAHTCTHMHTRTYMHIYIYLPEIVNDKIFTRSLGGFTLREYVNIFFYNSIVIYAHCSTAIHVCKTGELKISCRTQIQISIQKHRRHKDNLHHRKGKRRNWLGTYKGDSRIPVQFSVLSIF